MKITRAKKIDFAARLRAAGSEEAVKVAYIRRYGWKAEIASKVDLRVGGTLFEFKLDVDMRDPAKRARVLAQAAHYAGRIYNGSLKGEVPAALAICDRNEALLARMDQLPGILGRRDVDWDRAPCSPCPVLVEALKPLAAALPLYRVSEEAEAEEFGRLVALADQPGAAPGRPVTPANFEDAYAGWLEEVARHQRPAGVHLAFLEDLAMRDMSWQPATETLAAFPPGGAPIHLRVPAVAYAAFWTKWLRPPRADDLERIMASADRLMAMAARRSTGTFFTPPEWAAKAHEWLDRLAPGWRAWPLYDPAAGTGNLEYALGCSPGTWLSTLEAADAAYLAQAAIAPAAQCWQADYLADAPRPVGMPQPALVLMNPPYGEHGAGASKKHNKEKIANTAIGNAMGMGMADRELFAQFMWRVRRDHPNAKVGLFSTLKFMASPSYARFRKECWRMKLLGGFMFPAAVFDGVKGKFPIAFTVWEPAAEYSADVPLAIYDKAGVEVGWKDISCGDLFISSWLTRPKASINKVPLTGPVQVMQGRVFSDRIASGAIGTLSFMGTDVQHNGTTCAMSGAMGVAGTFSITPSNLRQACVMWAVRKLVDNTWINDRDQYSAPSVRLPRQWVADCVAYCLIHGSNQTSSLRQVEYKGKLWDVRNEWVVPTLTELRAWPCQHQKLRGWLRAAKVDSHIAKRLSKLYGEMSPEGRAAVDAVKTVWAAFYGDAHLLDLDKVKVSDWDAGWWQIRNALKNADRRSDELAAADRVRKLLKDRLLPGVYEYGFLPRAMMLVEPETK